MEDGFHYADLKRDLSTHGNTHAIRTARELIHAPPRGAPKHRRQEPHRAPSGIGFLITTRKDGDKRAERRSAWRKSKPGNLTCIVTAEMKRVTAICSDLIK